MDGQFGPVESWCGWEKNPMAGSIHLMVSVESSENWAAVTQPLDTAWSIAVDKPYVYRREDARKT